MSCKSPYPKEVRQRAIRMVSEVPQRLKTAWTAIRMVAARLAVTPGRARRWARQAEVDAEKRSRTKRQEALEIEAFRQGNAHLGEADKMPRATGSAQTIAAEEELPEQRRIRVDQCDEASNVSSATSASAESSAPTEGNGNNRPVALDPLNEGRLKERVSELFPAGYQTLMAIVQGVALVVLLEDGVKQEVFFSKHPYPDRLTAAVQALAVFAAIVIITHRYFLLTALARWRPTVIDTLLPYLLGTSEVVVALQIGQNAGWWIALSVLFLVAMASFVNTLMHTYEEVYGDLDRLYAKSKRAVKMQLINCLVLMLFSVSIALITIFFRPLPAQTYIICICGIIVAFIVVAIMGERGRNKAFSSYGIPDRHGMIQR